MAEAAASDPLVDEWHPVAIAGSLLPGQVQGVQLLDRGIALWRSTDGQCHAWEDRCPHRGMRLSMGRVVDDQLICPYHGWRFDSAGRCRCVPALPEASEESLKARVAVFPVRERYGLIWVSLGSPADDVLPFPEFADERLRKVWCGPYDVASSAPRIVENFLDMGHFAFVHTDILGQADHAEIPPYTVERFDDPVYGRGIWAKGCRAWQPRSNSLATGGGWVEYTYRVVRPLTAILTKEPETQAGFREAISLHLQPLTETRTRAWIILAMTNFEQSDEDLQAFQDTIFLQDLPIVENQVPLTLPLAPGAEASIATDRMSLAYRRYLRELGLRYGVTGTDAPETL